VLGKKKKSEGDEGRRFSGNHLLVRSSGGIDRYTQLTYCVSNFFFFLEKRRKKRRLFSPPAIRGSWLPAGPADSRSLVLWRTFLPHCGHETRGRTASPTLAQAPLFPINRQTNPAGTGTAWAPTPTHTISGTAAGLSAPPQIPFREIMKPWSGRHHQGSEGLRYIHSLYFHRRPYYASAQALVLYIFRPLPISLVLVPSQVEQLHHFFTPPSGIGYSITGAFSDADSLFRLGFRARGR